ncbi:MAG: hypothetical protein CFE23_11620 [Flavobacterium sp. BFFFF1]|uniref:hypothetical protein n=1 Tax=Flavobacterium sp. BFFFF1 TaxID=2015557 RepID=UPI000BDAABC5|nr:hypothetical protein [Flavobacterium sp. BFFFF1]OYU79897.1 MAG: hypothetical protein CFE23_11620 [Flavobacterium sp. BFFFF1]
MSNIDSSIVNFQNFRENIDLYKGEDLNESDTRSKLIDSLLIKVLGWEESNIRREGKVDSGYFDYHVSAPGINLIIEAKRTFSDILIPTSHHQAKINSLYKSNQELFDQIRGYSVDKGIQYGLLTNGRQFILCKLFNVDGSSWKENRCLIFDGHDDIERRFVEFYENLSQHSILSNGGFKYDFPKSTLSSRTVVSTLIDRDKELVRNDLSAALTPLIERIFGEIFSEESENDMELIERCFVENQETKKNRLEIERLFADKAPQLSNVVPAVNYHSIRKQINHEINSDEINIKNLIPPKPIVIVGSKGAGKSTFINHLFISDDYTDSDHLPIYLDLRKFFNSGNSLEPENVSKEILILINDKFPELELYSATILKRVYFREIRENDMGIWQHFKEHNNETYQEKLSDYLTQVTANKLEHLVALNRYFIRERRKRLVVIIDNADQYNNQIQENAFLFAHSLSRKSYCGTIISLREGYYYKWRSSPPFDAYESNVYHITAPKYSEVLQRRIDYTLEKIKITGNTIAYNEQGMNVTIPNQAVIEFLSGLKNSLFSESNSTLIDYLNYTTYPNIREGLKVFKQFLISGHTNVSDQIVRERFRLVGQTTQTIPIHEFVKAIGLNNKLYYDSETSLVNNVFIPSTDSDDHFLSLYILSDLVNRLEAGGVINKYLSLNELHEKFKSFGYRNNIINECIHRLLKSNLIDTDEQLSDIEWDSLPFDCNIAITSKGYYYYRELCGRFHYLDLVLQDTPVFDVTSFENIKESFPLSDTNGKRNLQHRVQTVKNFIEYLKMKDTSQPAQITFNYGKISDYIQSILASDLVRIESRI